MPQLRDPSRKTRRPFALLLLALSAALAVGCEGTAVVGSRGDGGLDASLDVQCAAPQTACRGACVDLQASPDHCGACGTACATGEACVMGMCQRTCPAGQSACGGACVNLQTSTANCGACGTACAMGQTCTAGRCGCAAGTTSCTTDMVTACVNLFSRALAGFSGDRLYPGSWSDWSARKDAPVATGPEPG